MSKANREALQRFLVSKGAALTVDGAVGPLTRRALFDRTRRAVCPKVPCLRGSGVPRPAVRAPCPMLPCLCRPSYSRGLIGPQSTQRRRECEMALGTIRILVPPEI